MLSQLTGGDDPLTQLGGLLQLITGLDANAVNMARADREAQSFELGLEDRAFNRDMQTREAGRADRALALQDRSVAAQEANQRSDAEARRQQLDLSRRQVSNEGQRLIMSEDALRLQQQENSQNALFNLINSLSMMPSADPRLLPAALNTLATSSGITLPEPVENPYGAYMQSIIPNYAPPSVPSMPYTTPNVQR